MSAPKFSPSPWKVETLGDQLRVTTATHDFDNDDVAVIGDCRVERNRADAVLIAAAPELYAQLEFAVKLLDDLPGFIGTAQIASMHALLAKAVQS